MAYDVTSWFVDQTLIKNPPNLVRKFSLDGVDYSDSVFKWPTFNQSWDSIRPVSLTLDLANEDQGMNFIRDNKTIISSSASIEFGYTHSTSGDELISLFTGKLEHIKYSRGVAALTLTDKFKQLTERIVGTSDVPVSFTTSNYLPADIVWWLVTSYADFSTTIDSSNPDIDYLEWKEWSDVFSVSAVFINAEFTGQKVAECIRKIGRITRSAIFIKEDRLTFHRFSIADSNQSALDNDSIESLELSFDEEDMVNKQYVYADYSPTSDFHQTTVFDVGTSSVNSYGLKEDVEKDTVTWYVGSGPALDAAQRIISTNSELFDKVVIDTTLVGITRLLGETITVTDSFHGFNNNGFRIMKSKIDINKGTVRFNADTSQYDSPFILDTSTLDSLNIVV